MKHTQTAFFEYDTPLGRVRIVAEGKHILRLDFLNEGAPPPPEGAAFSETPEIAGAFAQLTAYFKGHRKFFRLPLKIEGTPFQKKVYEALLAIPYGQTVSYGELADAIGSPKAFRAVGMACHSNPLPIFVPCHRVVGSNGSLTGYAGGLPAKKFLLELERKNTKLFPVEEEALFHLKNADDTMAAFIQSIPKPRYELMEDLFSALCHSIVGQQISTRAHRAVWTRLVETLDGISPEKVLNADGHAFRACGISSRKAQYLKEAARFALSGGLEGAGELSDEAFRQRLTALKGVGKWTADMLLLFSLGRRDVFSYEDAGLRNGLCRLYGLTEINRETFEEYGKRFSPYGSVASFYLWAANALRPKPSERLPDQPTP